MVERFPVPVLLTTILLAGLFAGCVGDDPAPSGDDESDVQTPTGGSTPTGPLPGSSSGAAVKEPDETGCAFEFCLEGHVYAPIWREGYAWTYAVTGSLFPSEYEMTVGVYKVAEDHFKIGSNSEDELKNAVTFDGLLTANVQKDSYAVLKKGEYRDILGFRQLAGASWNIDGTPFYYNNWAFNKSATKDIEWAGGGGKGFRVEGVSSRGEFLNIEYSSDAKWITLLEYLNKAGEPQVRYQLQSFSTGFAVGELKQWEVGWSRVVLPIGMAPVNAANWQSSGTGKILMRLITKPGVTAEARLSSGATIYDLSHSAGAAVQEASRIEADVAGGWQGTIVVARDTPLNTNNALLYAIQIFESGA